MKCLACDEILSDAEATRKDSHGGFVDLCFLCFPIYDELMDEPYVERVEQDIVDSDE